MLGLVCQQQAYGKRIDAIGDGQEAGRAGVRIGQAFECTPEPRICCLFRRERG